MIDIDNAQDLDVEVAATLSLPGWHDDLPTFERVFQALPDADEAELRRAYDTVAWFKDGGE